MNYELIIRSVAPGRYTERYIKFLTYCALMNSKNVTDDIIVEKHHILPESLYPQYKSFKKNSWNMIILTCRQHFIAHWMLAKIFGGKQWFSFNMMKRIGHTGALYSASRKYVIEQIKLTNIGRIKTSKEIEDIKKRFTGKVVVKDKNGNTFQVETNDPRYISGELVYYRTGNLHRNETIELMKKNNGIRGKKAFIEDENVVYYSLEEGTSKGLKAGIKGETRKKLSATCKNKIWVTLKDGSGHKRIYENELDVNLHTKGRIGSKGWKHINERG